MSTADPMWTKEDVLRCAEEHRKAACLAFRKTGSYHPMTVLLATRSPVTGEPGKGLIALPLTGDFDGPGKEEYALLVRAAARAMDAIGLMFITEAWMAPEYAGPPEEHPERQEVLLFSPEHPRFGVELWRAPILRPGGNPPDLAPWEQIPGTYSGRFVHLLPEVS